MAIIMTEAPQERRRRRRSSSSNGPSYSYANMLFFIYLLAFVLDFTSSFTSPTTKTTRILSHQRRTRTSTHSNTGTHSATSTSKQLLFMTHAKTHANNNNNHDSMFPQQRFTGVRKRLLSLSLSSTSSSENSARDEGGDDDEHSNGTNTNTNTNSPSPLSSASIEQKIDDVLYALQNIRPAAQLVILLLVYIIHLLVLTQHCILFPFQLIPNDKGWFQSIGLDSVAGIISFISIGLLRQRQLRKFKRGDGNGNGNGNNDMNKVTIPSLFSGVYDDRIIPKQQQQQKQQQKPRRNSKKKRFVRPSSPSPSPLSFSSPASIPSPWKFPLRQDNVPSPRITSMVALSMLITAYFFTGRFASMMELYLYAMAGLGVPLTIAMHRSLVVLGGHLAWVAVGSGILGVVLRPQPFFGGGNKVYVEEKDDNGSNKEEEVQIKEQKYKWFSNKWDSNWLWWTISGYFISSWFFNIADFLNQIILPAHVFELAGEGVVSQLINPENNDFIASLVGYIAPCISAPWWEEVLYRGFLLPALTLQMKFWPAVFVSGIVFSVHHVSTTGAIPLAILGWTWAALYAKSGNLMVTILIHAMWNSRVFLGSWLGL